MASDDIRSIPCEDHFTKFTLGAQEQRGVTLLGSHRQGQAVPGPPGAAGQGCPLSCLLQRATGRGLCPPAPSPHCTHGGCGRPAPKSPESVPHVAHHLSAAGPCLGAPLPPPWPPPGTGSEGPASAPSASCPWATSDPSPSPALVPTNSQVGEAKKGVHAPSKCATSLSNFLLAEPPGRAQRHSPLSLPGRA